MQHYKDKENNLYGYRPEGIGVTPISMDEVRQINESKIDQKAKRINEINRQRKASERQGITHNGIRYAGSPEDRQALDEAVTFAEDAGITEFSAWKDSDNQFHANHPVADVVEAYRLIGQNRMRLIELEGQYIAQVQAGELTDVDGLDWS